MPRRPSTDRRGGARALALGLLALALQPIAASADPNPSDALHAIVAIQRAREGLVAAQRYMESRPDLFPARRLERERVLRPSLRADLLGVWESVSDYLLALGAVRDAHDGFLLARGSARGESLHLYRAAFLAQYRHALEIIERFERDPGFDKILDEPLPEIGLPRGSYARLKLHYLNVAIASEFAALEALAGTARTDPPEPLAEAIESDRSEIWRMGRGTGVRLTAANAGAVVEKTAFRAWFPVQAGVAEWMGDVKVWRPTHSLIGAAELDSALPRLEPGDILLTRREWYLSNLGLPGYWSHALPASPPAGSMTCSRAHIPPATRAARRLETASRSGFSRPSRRASSSPASSTPAKPIPSPYCDRVFRSGRRPRRSPAPSATRGAPTTSTSTS
jgi:hypothetical protein